MITVSTSRSRTSEFALSVLITPIYHSLTRALFARRMTSLLATITVTLVSTVNTHTDTNINPLCLLYSRLFLVAESMLLDNKFTELFVGFEKLPFFCPHYKNAF